MDESRLSGADFIRASACLAVFAHHLVQRLDPDALAPLVRPLYGFALIGAFGVSAFFVLSGYLLARPFWQALDAGAPMPSLRIYALRRTARIVPGFWLALTVSFVASVTLFAVPLDWPLVGRYLAGLFLVSDWHWSILFPVEFNGPLWSIAFEVTSYVFLPLGLAALFWLRPPRRGVWDARLVWVVAIVLVVGVHWLIVHYVPMDRSLTGWRYGLIGGAKVWVPRFNPAGFFAIFAIGALAAGFQVRWSQHRSLLFDGVVVAGLAVAFAAMIAVVGRREIEGFGLADIPYAYPWFPLGLAFALAAFPSSVFLGRMADNAAVVFVARISFGIYVWHYLVIETVRRVWLPDLAYQQIPDFRLWLGVSAALVAISFTIATASFYLLEQPVIRWARGLERRGLSWKQPRFT